MKFVVSLNSSLTTCSHGKSKYGKYRRGGSRLTQTSRERKKKSQYVVTVILITSKKCNFLFFSEPKHRKFATVFGKHFMFESLWWDCLQISMHLDKN